MSIDWSATGSWMQAWAGFAGAGAIVFAAKKGAETFASWKREKIEERRMDVAEKLIRAVPRAAAALRKARIAGFRNREQLDAEQIIVKEYGREILLSKDRAELDRLMISTMMHERCRLLDLAFGDLDDVAPHALAHLGNDVWCDIGNLKKHVELLRISAWAFLEDGGNPADYKLWHRRLFHGPTIYLDADDEDGREIARIATSLWKRAMVALSDGDVRLSDKLVIPHLYAPEKPEH